jgi:RND family efflux transporter MFP subunit
LLAGAARTHVNSVHATAIAQETRQNAVRAVLFAQPELAKGQRSLALPATLRGAQESPVHARTSGYVRSLHKDIGDRVRQGELLATLDTPEVDQDLAQARASVQQVQARLTLSQTSLSRVESLRNSDAVSQQELDERRAAFQSAQADLASARANVQRLEALQRFGRIVAPFDGVVVRRGVEVGALVAAGSATTNRELFYLAHDQALRLTVAVPQGFIEGVKVGQEVGLKLAERPQAKLTGQVQRIAGGLDAATRSVQVEVAVDNRDGKLKPGGYVEVAWQLSGAKPTLLLPPTAFQFRQDGPRVAVISADQTLSLQPVKLGRDLGKAIEVVEGLDEGQAVVLNPPDTIQAGEKVRAKEAPKEAPKDAPKDASKAPSRHKA